MDNFEQNQNFAPPAQQPEYNQYNQQNYQAPPQQTYNQYNQAPMGNEGRGGGWIGFVRVLLWIFFALMCIGTLIGTVACFVMHQPAGGVFTLIAGIFFSFASVAMGMIFLDLCNNVRKMTTNTERILQVLSRK